jgi:hypothetical protein
MTLQELWEEIRRTPEKTLSEGPKKIVIGEAGATTYYFSEIVEAHKVLKISPDEIEFPMHKMKG